MTLLDLIKIIRANITALLIVPITLGILVTILTKDSPQTYVSEAKVYTGIASGYSIESQQNSSFNFFAINNAFDNLINLIQARSTIEETAIRLYGLHLFSKEPRLPVMTLNSFNEIKRITPEEVYKLVDSTSYEKTIENLTAYKNINETNFLYKLINLNHQHYSVKAISGLKARRISNSDMIELKFQSDDPAVCYQTLKIIEETFIRNYSMLKENQTDAVVKYFEAQLEVAHQKLLNAENALLKFNMDNKIINYYEQTKHIASEKEKFEVERTNVMLDNAAAESVIRNLEANMGMQTKIKLQGENIIDLRAELNELNKDISLHQLKSISVDTSDRITLDSLINRADLVKKTLKTTVDSLHFYENTKEGIQLDDIINSWLKGVIDFEETKAKLGALEIRRSELEETVKHFAPLGANLKKIEREIDVNEREYLSLLHSLSLAKLKQQNIELSSNIKIVDPPVLPIKPLPSKRNFMIIAAVFAGFVITLAVIILLQFFDTTLQSTNRATKRLGLEGVGNFPIINKNKKKLENTDLLTNTCSNAIVNSILKVSKSNGKKSFHIGFFSNFKGEGKSIVIEHVMKKLDSEGLIVRFNGDEMTDKVEPDFIFTEIPGILKRVLPNELYKKYDLLCLVVRADRGWSKADENSIEIVRKICNCDIKYILNHVKTDNLGDFEGQIPKKRSKIRRIIKRFTMFRFFETFETS